MSITKNTRGRNGLEAWRKINRRFDPQTSARKKDAMARIVKTVAVAIGELKKWCVIAKAQSVSRLMKM